MAPYRFLTRPEGLWLHSLPRRGDDVHCLSVPTPRSPINSDVPQTSEIGNGQGVLNGGRRVSAAVWKNLISSSHPFNSRVDVRRANPRA